MSSKVLHELNQHAVEAVPEECCGLIVGNALERYLRVERCTNEMTALHLADPEQHPRDGTTAYYMSPKDVLRVQRAADEAGEVVTAVYHSHVGAGPYLSEVDLEYAEQELFPFPQADHIVVPVFERTAREVGLFRRGPGGFRGHPVERTDP
jgi:proteasome lid subunit RPN8/RPN11